MSSKKSTFTGELSFLIQNAIFVICPINTFSGMNYDLYFFIYKISYFENNK